MLVRHQPTYVLNDLQREIIGFIVWLVGLYGISTIAGYLMPTPFYTYILDIYDLVWLGFFGISTIVGYLMPTPFYTNILNI